ncbi:hypothetical protein EN12_19505 [Vibrio cholerae]|nr:hypothetical protein EN12_19505 [Vibrio cholerae]
MGHLIITIISIAVFAAFLTAGANYINPTVIDDIGSKTLIKSSLIQYSSGVMNYKMIHSKYPTGTDQFIPDIISQPKLPKNMSLSQFENNHVNGTVELCFDVEIKAESSLKMLKAISGDELQGNFIISDTCGSKTEVLPATFPVNKKITYIIR